MKKILGLSVFLLTLGVWSLTSGAEVGEKVEVNMQVLLISIENYELAPLKYAKNDIEKLSSLFQTRFGATSRAVIDRPNAGKDYKKAMEKVLSEWCKSLKEKDTCILYLAGHGVVGPDERLYLPMVDFNRRNFDTAAIPMAWIREQLAQAKGKCKLILLDTCFAGTGKSLDDFAISNSEQMAKTFETLPKVATLASSRADQKSWLWQERKHSLYTFWLIEGFRGNADLNNDLTLDVDELFNYLEENIAWVSESDPMMEPQNPLLLNDSQIKETFRLPLLAATSKETLENAASLIDLYLRRLPKGMVMVPEFSTGPMGEDPVIQDDYGTLPRVFAALLQRQLSTLSSSRHTQVYKVLNSNAARQVLQENHLTPNDLGAGKTTNLQSNGRPIRYFVLGRLYYAPNQVGMMELEITLEDALEQNTVATFHSKIQLNSSELGDLGKSGSLPRRNNPHRENEYVVTDGGLVDPNAAVTLAQLIVASEKVNPMMNGELPFKVEIYVRKAGSSEELTLRAGKVVGNEYYLPLDKGEEYQIWVRNHSNQLQFIRVLVDGMNTLSQSMQAYSKGMEVVASKKPKSELAPIVNLEDARAWVTEPEQVLQLEGFYDVNNQTPKDSGLYRFELGDADESLGARKSYTEKLGRITIGIYQGVQPAVRRSATVATKTQAREQKEVKIYAGKLIPAEHPTVIYNLRYVSQEEFDKL
ncbi:MAG: caspase family protein [Planctomycetia bacterium]|nr:caspase family protein [Planctomycetia bacterium]